MAFHLSLTLAFGLLGNIVSFMVYLAPIPTFYKVYKRKSTEGFQSLPYVVALFSSMLWIYYAILKQDATLLITVNSVGCVIETIYIVLFLFYAPKMSRIQTGKLLLLLIAFGYGLMLVLTIFLAKGQKRIKIVGWICLVINLIVFAAPLFIMRRVIRTKSVEFMPFPLSFFLTLGAVMWFFYGFLLKDYNIALPNILGFVFGIIQMVLYMFYKNAKKILEEPKLQELSDHIIDVVMLSTMVCPELNEVVLQPNGVGDVNIIEAQNLKEKIKETKEDMNDNISVQV
ncbi:hypothetical protein FNV43_RR21255 [Rhamnella rubrinervis]|uniref:Bidirectional sugar transporter SWEET n=1 Tax=Rhamnella rubrinervis TaxID=2594499 RepID=A0A8K0GV89_9ROSA|nr:hypothetical protein FNV43_RR21255 [Rhamnella rubrinervis]